MPPIIAAYLPLLPIYIHLVVLQMGGYFSSIIEWASFGKHAQILILGLDASGKTTIINRLKTGTHAVTVPTIGFNSETIEFNNLTFHAWDIGGQDSIRKLWHHYYPNTDGVVFIVDSADTRRFQLAQRELHALMCNPLLSSIPFLIFANKQDIAGAATTSEVTDAMKMYTIKNRPWKVAESVGVSGVGIDEGFNWLSKNV